MALTRANKSASLGRYQLVCELAQSYLGALWAVRVSSGEGEGLTAVVRRITVGASSNQDLIDRLSEAAWTAMEVQHDWIPKVVDVIVRDSELAIVSDYNEGLPLRNVCRQATIWRKPVPPGVALRVTMDLLEALVELHQQAGSLGELGSDVFGGVTPDSVLVGTDGHAHLLDVVVAGTASTVPALRDDPERVAYAAPEQLGTGVLPDARTDIFCTAILLWEMLSNRRLFVGFGESAAQKVLLQKIPRLDQIKRLGGAELPGELVQLVAQALDRDPKGRPQSATEMLQSLRNVGVAPAAPEETTAFLEQIAERDITRQRNEVAEGKGEGPKRKLSATFRSVRPAPPPPGEEPSHPEPAESPTPAPVGRGTRRHKQTLLGVAPVAAAAPPAQKRGRPAPLPAEPAEPSTIRRPPPVAAKAAAGRSTMVGVAPPAPGAAAPATGEPTVNPDSWAPAAKATEPATERKPEDAPAPAASPPAAQPGTPPGEPGPPPRKKLASVPRVDADSATAARKPMPSSPREQVEPAPPARKPLASAPRVEPAGPPPAESLAERRAKRSRDPGKQTLLGVAPPAAGSHAPSLPNRAAGPMPPAPGEAPRPGDVEEEPTAQFSPSQAPWLKGAAESAPPGADQPAEDSAAALAKTQLDVAPAASAPKPEQIGPEAAKPAEPAAAMIAAAIAEAAAEAPQAAEAADAAASNGVDEKVEGTVSPPPLLHDQRVSQAAHPPARRSSRFGAGFLAGVATTLTSVAIGALVIAYLGGRLPFASSAAPAAASAEAPPVPAASSAVAAASAAPSATGAALASADSATQDAGVPTEAGADAADAAAEEDEDAEAPSQARAPRTPVYRPRPRPRRARKYIPDDI